MIKVDNKLTAQRVAGSKETRAKPRTLASVFWSDFPSGNWLDGVVLCLLVSSEALFFHWTLMCALGRAWCWPLGQDPHLCGFSSI